MNPIAKELLKSFLTEEELQTTVGVFGGGFQPPTRGHLEVVKQALERYPLLDKFIIFVGTGGGRSNITQAQSVEIWNIYKKLLPSKVEIIPSSNPISSIYSYAKENPETKVKWFLGSREGREEDFIDFVSRTKSADKPNLEAINIVTKNPVSGTAARKSLGEKELFFTFLPSELPLEDKEKIFSILQGVSEWIQRPEIDNIDDYADEKLYPLDIRIPSHFIDRVNDIRNKPGIESDELYDFFDKLSDEKDELEDMLDDEGEIVATDSDTNINIPLAKDSKKPNTVVAKTIMRKRNFMTPNKKLVFEEDFFKPLEDDIDDERLNYYIEYYKNLSPSEFQVEKQKDKVIISNISKKKLEHNPEFKKLLVSLTSYMMDQISIDPLPNIKFIEDDNDNANDLLGKTAYYDPNTQTIVLYTYNRHPKDVLRSYAHEMIHHKQNLEGKIQNIQGQNINEDDYLKELEAEAYLQGNGLLFRGWENSIKPSINEWVIDTPKYNFSPSLLTNLSTQLHELKINEIALNPENAVEINGDLYDGEFKIGDIKYIYSIKNMPSPYKDNELFYNIQFDEKHNSKLSNEPTGNAKENYIKILSTIYKIILDFVEKEKPKYIGISSLDKSGYWNIYNNLTKTNKLPGYSRKDVGLDFTAKSGDKGKFIVLKRND